MTYTATITSKGQITIPLAIRKLLNLSKQDKVAFVTKNHKVEIKPIVDFMSLQGSVKKKKYNGRKVDEIVGKNVAGEYAKKFNRH